MSGKGQERANAEASEKTHQREVATKGETIQETSAGRDVRSERKWGRRRGAASLEDEGEELPPYV